MKQLLNDMSFEERQNIREQHTGGMKVMSGSFRRLVNAKLGDSKPLISEQPTPQATDSTVPTPQANDSTVPTPPVPQKPSLPTCQFKGNTNMPGTGFEMSGAYTKITTNGSVAPQYQGYTVHTANGPFCFIPRN
jgi:hypothetical protein